MQFLLAGLGGLMIGAAGALLLLTHGRVAGVSGIVGNLVRREASGRTWRVAFAAGLLASGAIAGLVAPSAVGASVRSLPILAIAGLLVGYGTQLGSGCTSGHGVCGIPRLSVRSLIAVGTFMTTGAISAMIAGQVS